MSPNSMKVISLLAFILQITSGADMPKDPGLIRDIVPDLSKAKGLICYQCYSNSSENVPLCNRAIFKLSQPKEKERMTLQCPYYQSSYCFIHTKYQKKNNTETIRGCAGPKDNKGNDMKVGCARMKNQDLCLCSSNLCNGEVTTSAVFSFISTLSLYLLLVE